MAALKIHSVFLTFKGIQWLRGDNSRFLSVCVCPGKPTLWGHTDRLPINHDNTTCVYVVL